MKARSKAKQDLPGKLEPHGQQPQKAEKTLTVVQRQNEELLASDRLIRMILDQAAEVVIVCNEEGKIIRTSHLAHRVFPSRLLQRPFDAVCPLTFFPSRPLQPNRFSISDVLKGRIFRAIEVTHQGGGGLLSHFLLTARPLLHKGKKVVGGLVMLTDITERKRIEEELRKSRDEMEIRVQERTSDLAKANEGLLREIAERERVEADLRKAANIIENAGFGVAVGNGLNNTLEFVNLAYAQQHGFTRAEMIGMPFLDLYPPGARADLIEWVRRVDTEGQAAFESEHMRKDGSIFPVLIISKSVKDNRGKVLYRTVFTEDISRLKQAEENLREQTKILEAFFASTITPLVFLDRDFNFIRVNEAYAIACQRDISEFKGQNHFELYPHEENEAIFRRVVETKVPFQSFAKPFSFPDHPEWGVTYWDWTLTPILGNEGEVEFLVYSLENVTERKKAEEALRESEGRLRLLSSQLIMVQENERLRVAREIHDGLGQILTATKFKMETVLHKKGRKGAKEREKLSEAIMPMIQETIEEARRVQMDLRPSILDDLGILATLSWFCRQFQATYPSIRVQKEIDIEEEEVPALVKTTIYRVSQEALNNVAKHGGADLVRLSLTKTEGTIALAIQDNGRGFDLGEALACEGSRRGFGLSSMRERTELSGGSFRIESEIGKGTTIRATWPIG